MLPPVDEAVLQSNPQFAALYRTLSTSVLNPDGSTRDDPAHKEREATRKKLNEHRLRAAKQHLLAQAIASAAPSDPSKAGGAGGAGGARRPKPARRSSEHGGAELPEPLLDLLLLLPPLLAGDPERPLSEADARLLLSSPPLADLPALLPDLAALVSSALHHAAVLLTRIANTTTNASFVHRAVPSLPEQLRALRASAERDRAALGRARLAAAAALASLLRQHAQALALLVRALEAKHGSVARSLELRAAEVALEARRGEAGCAAALAGARREVYTPAAAAALRNYARHLRDGQMRLFEGVRSLQAQLEAYGVAVEGSGGGDEARERTMREMARVHREMARQMEEAKADMQRLGRA